MSKKQEYKQLLKLICAFAWPTIVEQLLATAVNYVDTAMVGSLGANASAAVGATMTVNWMMNGIVSSLGVGFLAFIARSMGAGKPDLARRAAGQAVTVAMIGGTIVTAVALSLSRVIPVWMHADPEILDDARAYFFILYVPMIFRAALLIFGTVLRAGGDTKTPMKANVATNLINVVLNFLLIYETRPMTILGISLTMPGAGWGVRGAAIASAISFACGGVWMTAALFGNKNVSPKGYTMKPDSEILRPCFKIALPSVLQRLATSTGYVMFSAMINNLGAVSTAAHSIANTAESAFYIPGWGMQTAASTLIGNAYGEKNNKKLTDLSRLLLLLEFGVMLISGAILFLGAGGLMRIFTNDEDVIAMGSKVLRMVALSEPLYGVAIIIEGIFNGMGDTLQTFIFNVIGMWGVRILGSYIFVSRMGYGLTAAWGCMIAHNMTLAVLLSIKYLRGKWRPKGTLDEI